MRSVKPLFYNPSMHGEPIIIAIYGQSCALAGRLCVDPEARYGPEWESSADLLILRGSRLELLTRAQDYARDPRADGGYSMKVARSIRGELLETDAEIALRLRGESIYDPRTKRELEAGSWSNRWPTIDRNGILTGSVVDSCDGFWNYEDEAMIAREEAQAGGWVVDADYGYALPPQVP